MYGTSHASNAYFFLIDKSLCYGAGSGTIVGIIFADVAVTVLIVTTTYWYASKRRQKKENGEKLHRPRQMFSSNSEISAQKTFNMHVSMCFFS